MTRAYQPRLRRRTRRLRTFGPLLVDWLGMAGLCLLTALVMLMAFVGLVAMVGVR